MFNIQRPKRPGETLAECLGYRPAGSKRAHRRYDRALPYRVDDAAEITVGELAAANLPKDAP